MRVLIVSDLRACVRDGRILLGSQHYYVVKRYHDIFGAVTLCARVVHDENEKNWIDATDVVDELVGLKSLSESLLPGFGKRLQPHMEQAELVVARLHSIMGMRALACAQKQKTPTLAELMGDAWDAFWNHGLVGKLIAPYTFLQTRRLVRRADYALYVTNEWLQQRYPCSGPSVAVSNVQIAPVDGAVLEKRLTRIAGCDWRHITLMTSAAVDVRYKGQEHVIRAILLLNRQGIRVTYRLAGGGDQAYLRGVAEKCGVADQVEFLGRLPMEEIYRQLEEADVYIQPSLQEGLPRAMIEAMSRGCICLGARTGGIPELIEEQFVFKRASAPDVARKLAGLARLDAAAVAKRNFAHAQGYLTDVLDQRRKDFFERIKADLSGR